MIIETEKENFDGLIFAKLKLDDGAEFYLSERDGGLRIDAKKAPLGFMRHQLCILPVSSAGVLISFRESKT